jgi:hypothetical protein
MQQCINDGLEACTNGQPCVITYNTT